MSGPLDPEGDVSVVVVAYRTPDVLARCLESFEREHPRRVREVIVVDNSADGTAAPPFPWIRYVANERNVHFRRGVNQGARLATGRYLFLLNPDTELTEPDSIARLAEVLDREPSVGAVGPRMAAADGYLAPQGERRPGLLYLLALRLHLHARFPGNPIRRQQLREGASRELSGVVETVSAACLLCRREDFLAVGGFDEGALAYWEEPELSYKLHRRGLNVYYCADAFVLHHWRQGGMADVSETRGQELFEQGLRVYYRHAYGRLGTAVVGVLDLARRAVQR